MDRDNREERSSSGKIVMGLGPISLVPVDVRIVHVHGNT